MVNPRSPFDRLWSFGRSHITLIISIILFLGFGWLLLSSYQETRNILDSLIRLGPVGGAIGTLALALATWATVQETRRARKQQVNPHLTFEFTGEVYRGNIGVPAITNIGNGPAIDADLQLQFGEDGPAYSTKQHVRAGASIPVTQPQFEELVRTDSDLYEQYNVLHLNCSYQDVTGQHHETNEKIDLNEVRSTAAYSGMTPIDFT